MHPDLYRQIFSVQGLHWWGHARRKLSLALLRRAGVGAACSHLDLGCGTGQNLRLLEELQPARVVGVDLSADALQFAKRAADCELIRHDIGTPLPFADKSFDVVTIFNVLYHQWVRDEVAVLREARRVLKTPGILLMTEPAFPALARELDVAVMTKRRYRRGEIATMIAKAGLQLTRCTYMTSFGAPLILARKMFRAPSNGSVPDMALPSPLQSRILLGAATTEAHLIAAGLSLPFGTTIIAVASRV